eukprot:CAMPEP_0170496612 /NCGR_PEP_ID=MMETSP0208-20121228/22264_1 /TAXON_ID=197538 /ORGANISM="Strombidium inclinatum, Strain S3" /LENGTH=35 /DNA_ID= /DNA_START= /DNA_END= /DNA_ORIENTATION=
MPESKEVPLVKQGSRNAKDEVLATGRPARKNSFFD